MSITSAPSRDTALLADPVIGAVPVQDNGEPLVALPDAMTRPGHPVLVRAGLRDRLVRAKWTLPPHRRLLVVEGHRRPDAQLAIWDRYGDEVRVAHPDADPAEQRRLTSRFVSPIEVAPHVAGAAVDITLVDRDGLEVDLGTPIDATPEQSAGACAFDAPVPAAARAERDLLASALGWAGLVNYPTEWWHWSWGDRYWAWTTSSPAAVYGPIDATGAAR